MKKGQTIFDWAGEKMSSSDLYRRGVFSSSRRALSIRNEYGLSPESFFDLVNHQEGVCPITLEPLNLTVRGGVHVDHCHETLKIRGLLSPNANRAIGNAKDSPTVLQRMSEYLAEDRVIHQIDRSKSRSRGRPRKDLPRPAKTIRDKNLWHKYRVTQDTVDEWVGTRSNKCDICLQEMSSPCVDHNHETDCIRGILCRPCNAALGLFHDDPNRPRRAGEYLTV